MAERDDLAVIINKAACGCPSPHDDDYDIADAILAAGWVPGAALAAAEGQVDVTRRVLIDTELAHTHTAERLADLTATVRAVERVAEGWEAGYEPVHHRGYIADLRRALDGTVS